MIFAATRISQPDRQTAEPPQATNKHDPRATSARTSTPSAPVVPQATNRHNSQATHRTNQTDRQTRQQNRRRRRTSTTHERRRRGRAPRPRRSCHRRRTGTTHRRRTAQTRQTDRPDSKTAAGDGQARPTSDVGAGEHPVRAGRATGDEQARPTGDEPHESARRSRQQSAAATRINDRLLGTPHKSDSNTATGDEQAQLTGDEPHEPARRSRPQSAAATRINDRPLGTPHKSSSNTATGDEQARLTGDEPHESARRGKRSRRQSICCGVSAGGRGWRVTVAAVVESAVFGAQERISVPRRSAAAVPGLRRC